MAVLSNWEILERLLIAAALGSLIGFERERLLWAAGIRTHMLVCVGACLFMIVSAYGFSASNVTFDLTTISSSGPAIRAEYTVSQLHLLLRGRNNACQSGSHRPRVHCLTPV